MWPAFRIGSLIASLLAGWTLAAVPPAEAVQPGAPAPPFTLATAGGDTLALANLRGRVVYVDFWASWCGPCRRSFPWMSALQDRYGKAGLAIVGVNVDKRSADAARFLRDTPARFAIAYDAAGATASAYDVRGMPSSFLVDRQGVVVAVEEGFHEDHKAAMEERIRALLAAH